jgi:hypothetical protein
MFNLHVLSYLNKNRHLGASRAVNTILQTELQKKSVPAKPEVWLSLWFKISNFFQIN